MPIRKELRKFYGREWQTVTRPRILARAGNRCENCGKPNGETIESRFAWGTAHGPRMWWRRINCEVWHNHAGEVTEPPRLDDHILKTLRFRHRETIGVVKIGVAHLNHTPGDDRDDNLKALCGWCHLMHDRDHHHQTRATRKDAARPMLTGAIRL